MCVGTQGRRVAGMCARWVYKEEWGGVGRGVVGTEAVADP